jgi:endonuclease/exonuclease/phosphatase (EEP) superfamily protein YafD
MSADAHASDVRSRVSHVVAVGTICLVLLSLALRFSVRDRVPGLSAVYYATPPALDAAGAVVAAFLFLRLRRRRAAAICATVGLACTATFVAGSLRFGAPRPPGALRGVHWNVAHGYWGWTRIADTLATFDPDLVWLSESDDANPEEDDALRAALPGRTVLHERGGLTVIVRGDASCVERAHLDGGGHLARSHLVVGGRAFESVHVDAPSSPFARRDRIFADALRRVEPHVAAPLLVVGDFNTPRDSAAFDAWCGPLAHAFETAGRGCDATWPVPIPVLSIDHVWAGGGLTVRTCEPRWTRLSDHRPVEFTFDVP